jgi:hypothetical protein
MMKDMKRTKKERKEANKPMSYDGEDYAYGLTVSLGPEEVKKLGGLKGIETGQTVHIQAEAKVVSVSDEEGDGRRVKLQLQKMDCQGDPDEEYADQFDKSSKGGKCDDGSEGE